MSIQNNDRAYINAFGLISGVGPQKLYLIAKNFDNFHQAWHATAKELVDIGISTKLVDIIIENRSDINPQEQWKKLQDNDIQLISIKDKNFPKKLKNISSPPFLLYVRGNIDILDTPSVAVVGSRKISDYGKHAITSIVRDIARREVTIVSGLALGTDSLAHRETLDVNGITIAVLGGGIDDNTITPHCHINLAKQILECGGAIISEYPIDTQPNRGTFPARNRLMAGLTDATIIIEATKKSGTLITAEHAYKFGRKLFALPGSIFAQNSVGPNTLIRDMKASTILCSDDIMCIFKDTHETSIKKLNARLDNKTQEILYRTIKKHPNGANINTIIKETKLDGSTISSELTMMEIDGVVKNIGNQTYITSS